MSSGRRTAVSTCFTLVKCRALTNVVLVDVGVDKAELGLVVGVLERALDNLEHGGDTGTTGDHEEVGGKVLGVDKLALGALDHDRLTDLEVGKVLRDVALLVGLPCQHVRRVLGLVGPPACERWLVYSGSLQAQTRWAVHLVCTSLHI